MNNKIIRSICYFTQNPDDDTIKKLGEIEALCIKSGYDIQTKRICSPDKEGIFALDQKNTDGKFLFSLGSVGKNNILSYISLFANTKKVSFNYDLTDEGVTTSDVQILFDIITRFPAKTFNFTYTFNNSPSSPFFPSATFEKEGFSIGLQLPDLAQHCISLTEWLMGINEVLVELANMFKNNPEFLGIDSSVAPLYTGKSSFIYFIKRISSDFAHSVLTSTYVQISQYIKSHNPKPVGLCGLMFPALEDFELAAEYERGNFPVERTIFLSLHSGLGIDTYPIGIDEKKEKVLEILQLIQALSEKYKKPLSVRFVSDGKANIGETTQFNNQYLKDVRVRAL
jgi:hypothetical protein